ncbi:MAG TPA: TraR/DksA C4-type zinc finger protein [Streptosporangiaceae bacterium]|jgi:RNA polymerase-binding protein DksA
MTTQESARELLIAGQADALRILAALERELTGIVESSGQAGTDDEHDPDGATLAYERQHVAALLSQAREHLAQIRAALRKLDDGGYGTCETCGQPIAPARLAARPATPLCLDCATRR